MKARRELLHAKALHGNPFDGHALGPVVAELEELGAVMHVTIRLGGKLESFRDSFGAIWQRCSSV